MDLLGRGYRTREIARALNISERAITAHITKLMAIFGVPNRTGLIAAGMTGSSQARLATPDERELDRYEDAPFLVAVTIGFSRIAGRDPVEPPAMTTCASSRTIGGIALWKSVTC